MSFPLDLWTLLLFVVFSTPFKNDLFFLQSSNFFLKIGLGSLISSLKRLRSFRVKRSTTSNILCLERVILAPSAREVVEKGIPWPVVLLLRRSNLFCFTWSWIKKKKRMCSWSDPSRYTCESTLPSKFTTKPTHR